MAQLAGVLALGDAASHPSESYWARRELLEAIAATRPLAVVLDDMHRAEATLLELLEVGRVGGAPFDDASIVLRAPHLPAGAVAVNMRRCGWPILPESLPASIQGVGTPSRRPSSLVTDGYAVAAGEGNAGWPTAWPTR